MTEPLGVAFVRIAVPGQMTLYVHLKAPLHRLLESDEPWGVMRRSLRDSYNSKEKHEETPHIGDVRPAGGLLAGDGDAAPGDPTEVHGDRESKD